MWPVEDVLTAITLITLLAIVIGDRVLGWLKTRGVDLTKMSEIYELAYNTHQNTQALIKLFDDSTLGDAIRALSDNIAVQTKLLGEISNQNQLNRDEHQLILNQMERIGNR